MASKRIFLHIGTHKTATTTIQKGCCDNHAALLAVGWLYPSTGMYLYGQHNIAWEMCSGHEQPWNHVNQWVRFRPEWGGVSELLAEIEASPAQNVILSSEDFDGLQTDRIRQLQQHLQAYQVEVIVYLREQASFLQSAWAQFVKCGYIIESFEAFIDRMLASGDDVLRYFGAYDVFLQPWMDAFGDEHVHPKVFSRDAFQGHIFHDFLRECQLEQVERFAIPADQNISPGFKTLEMARLMAMNVESMKDRGVITRLMQKMGNIKQWDSSKLNLIDGTIRARIQERFTAANSFLDQHFNQGERLFPVGSSDKPLSQFDKAQIKGDEWEEIARSIATYFVKELGVSVNLYEEWKK